MSMNLKVLFFIMELLISDIIFLTLNKIKANGFNLMIKESDNMILEILKVIALVGKTGEDNLKAHIFWSLKKSKRGQLYCNFKINNKNKLLYHYLV